MKRKKIAVFLTACAGVFLLSGCGGKGQKLYKQAVADMEQGSYEYALEEFVSAMEQGVDSVSAYRGMGISNLHLGKYEEAEANFTSALEGDKIRSAVAKDLYMYRATARLKLGRYEEAMADCQTLSMNYESDADTWFLTGKTALALDAYDEAASDFDKSYAADSTYDRALKIYEVYLEKGMEADGTGYLETVLSTDPKTAQDYCDRGRVYYYMEDYPNAQQQLEEALNKDNSEAALLLGMVYMAQQDYVNARAMYQQYINEMLDVTEGPMTAARGYNGLALCDMAEENFDSAIENINNGIIYAEGDEMQSLLFNEAVIYEKKLDFALALQKMQSYLEIYPEDAEAVKEIAFLKSRT